MVLHRLLPAHQRQLHRQIAEAAEALYAGELDAHSAMLALHYRAAQMWERALPYLRRTGLDALVAGAQREAAGCFEQAIDAVAGANALPRPSHPAQKTRTAEPGMPEFGREVSRDDAGNDTTAR